MLTPTLTLPFHLPAFDQDLFAEVARDGPGALQKYWDNTELMSKVGLRDGAKGE